MIATQTKVVHEGARQTYMLIFHNISYGLPHSDIPYVVDPPTWGNPWPWRGVARNSQQAGDFAASISLARSRSSAVHPSLIARP